jgi:hypothetical protein
LANSVVAVTAQCERSCVRKKIEFASLPRFLSRGGIPLFAGQLPGELEKVLKFLPTASRIVLTVTRLSAGEEATGTGSKMVQDG